MHYGQNLSIMRMRIAALFLSPMLVWESCGFVPSSHSPNFACRIRPTASSHMQLRMRGEGEGEERQLDRATVPSSLSVSRRSLLDAMQVLLFPGLFLSSFSSEVLRLAGNSRLGGNSTKAQAHTVPKAQRCISHATAPVLSPQNGFHYCLLRTSSVLVYSGSEG